MEQTNLFPCSGVKPIPVLALYKDGASLNPYVVIECRIQLVHGPWRDLLTCI